MTTQWRHPNPRVILIEGTEATGKSSLARRIADQYDTTALHFGPPKTKTWEEEYLLPVVTSLAIVGAPVVLDRGWISEAVWCSILGDLRTPVWDDKGETLMNVMRVLGVQYIHCTATPQQILQTLDERGESDEYNDAIACIPAYEQAISELADRGAAVLTVTRDQIAEGWTL